MKQIEKFDSSKYDYDEELVESIAYGLEDKLNEVIDAVNTLIEEMHINTQSEESRRLEQKAYEDINKDVNHMQNICNLHTSEKKDVEFTKEELDLIKQQFNTTRDILLERKEYHLTPLIDSILYKLTCALDS